MKEGWEDINEVLHFQVWPYIPKISYKELISRYYDDLLAGHFWIKKTQELVAQKYYYSIFYYDVKTFVNGYDICLTSKPVRHKPYRDLQSLPVTTYC